MPRKPKYIRKVRRETLWEEEEVLRVEERAQALGEDLTEFLHVAARERLQRLARKDARQAA